MARRPKSVWLTLSLQDTWWVIWLLLIGSWLVIHLIQWLMCHTHNSGHYGERQTVVICKDFYTRSGTMLDVVFVTVIMFFSSLTWGCDGPGYSSRWVSYWQWRMPPSNSRLNTIRRIILDQSGYVKFDSPQSTPPPPASKIPCTCTIVVAKCLGARHVIL